MSFEEDTQPIVEQTSENVLQVRVYHKRWYILAVFSVLGVLQVRKYFTTKLFENHPKRPKFTIFYFRIEMK